MSKYSTLKAEIIASIKRNGAQAITGDLLQEKLLSMIDSLGEHYQFGGLALPSTEFTAGDEPVVFIAATPGTYTDFGGLVVADGEVALLVWDGSTWSKQTTDIATRTEVSQLGQYFGVDGKYIADNGVISNSDSVYRIIKYFIPKDGKYKIHIAKNEHPRMYKYTDGSYTTPDSLIVSGNGSNDYDGELTLSKGYYAISFLNTNGGYGDVTRISELEGFESKINTNYDDIIDKNTIISKVDFIYHYFYNNTGKIDSDNRRTTKYIKVEPGDEFIVSYLGWASGYTIAAFDKDFKLLTAKSTDTHTYRGFSYTVPEGVSYLRFTSVYTGQDRDLESTRIYLNQIKTSAKKLDLSEFDFTGWADNIADDSGNGPIVALSAGMIAKYPVKTNEDEFVFSASFTPRGDTFECGFGKIDDEGQLGTLVTLYKDSNASGVKIYKSSLVNSVVSNTLAQTITLQTITIASGVRYYLILHKITSNYCRFKITISDQYGNMEELGPYTGGSGSGLVGYAHGYMAFVNITGRMDLYRQVSFSYPDSDKVQTILLGHSYVEGLSLAGDQDKRWAALLSEKAGKGKVVTLGWGGDTISGLLAKLLTYLSWYSGAKYALIYIGANDINGASEETLPTKYAELVAGLKEVNDKCRAFGILPIFFTDNYFPAGSNLVGTAYDINVFIRNNFIFIETDYIFKNPSTGQPETSWYLSDQTHPNIAGNERIYNAIMSQVPFVAQ